MKKKRIALGRGLDALLGDHSQFSKEKNNKSTNTIPIASIKANEFQPRQHFDDTTLQELASSIKTHGLIQPLTVRELSADSYQLISGERRYRASQLAGLQQVPVYIRKGDDQQILEMALIENIQREDLNPLEIALSYHRLINETGVNQETLGNRVGKKRSTVANYLRLLKLPPLIQTALLDQSISMGHARALIGIEHIEGQLLLFKEITAAHLSVRQTEEKARLLVHLSQKTASQKPSPVKKENQKHEKNIRKIETTLSSHFGVKIKLNDKAGKGSIHIPYYSIDDLNRILSLVNLP